MNTFTRDIFEIASLLVGLSLITLILNRPQAFAQVASSSAGNFNMLLRTVTLQGDNFNLTNVGYSPF